MDYTIKTLSYKNKIVFEKLRTSTFERFPKLFNENEACFMFIEDGSFSVRMPDNCIDFSKGQGFLAKCFDYFFETSPKQRIENEHIEIIGVLIFPEMVQEIFQLDLLPTQAQNNYNLKKVEIDLLLKNFKNSINILLDNPELADEQLIKTKLKEFILLISRTEENISQQAFLSNLFIKKETEFKKTILYNLYSTLSLSEFAHLCNMSESTFKRKFKQTFGESPIKYITNKKLEKAATLLSSKELRISDIAYDCGFSTISSFNRAFKEKYKQSPSEYRLA